MNGLMMNIPLMISSVIKHAEQFHGDTEIISCLTEGGVHRYTYSAAERRSRQLAKSLQSLGVGMGDRVGTLAWNNHRHFELYFGVSGMGAICHTINPRLFPEQISFIINHAEDNSIFFDLSFLPLMEKLAPHCPSVKSWVLMAGPDHLPDESSIPNLLCYEDLVDSQSDDFEWPTFDENTASSLCYTSGTTGNPKGVLYSHRSTILHAYAAALPDSTNLNASDVVLPAVPMFHVNAWGIPYSAPLTGAKLVLPGPYLDGKSLYEIFEKERVTYTAGIPTVWLGLFNHLQQYSLTLSSLKRVVVGGVTCPPSIIKTFEKQYGVNVLHGWGMTETSPIGTLNTLKAKHAALSPDQQCALKAKQGRGIYGLQIEIVDGKGNTLPHDGVAKGDLLVRGPWVASGYYKEDNSNLLHTDAKGRDWFPSGDVASIDPDGYLQITDRSKDIIKSGGEWISSVDLENIAITHPAVAEAAVISIPHPKWGERPLLLVVKKASCNVTREQMLEFYTGKVLKWWCPDDVVFVDSLPHTATGKLLKTKLRDDFANHKLPMT